MYLIKGDIMGSSNLALTIRTGVEKKFLRMFNAIQESERREYGSDPYSGSWATIPGVRIVPDPFPQMKKWTNKKKNLVWEWIFDNTEKWEKAKAVKANGCYLVGGWCVS